MKEFDYKKAFLQVMELIDGGGVQEDDVPDRLYRKYYEDTGQEDMLEDE